MGNPLKRIALATVATLAIAAPALADTVSTIGGSGYGPYQTGLGGEFTLRINDTLGGPDLDVSGYAAVTSNLVGGGILSFQTFCIEGTEYIYPSATYDVAIDTAARNGGATGGNPDPVSVGTGWLYSQFARGTLAYDYSNSGPGGRAASANALQQAIWWLEGEENVAYNASNAYMLAVVTQFTNAANAMANGGEQFGVYALNLSAGFCSGNVCQDQLYYKPTSTVGSNVTVPDGGSTAVLLGLASCAAAAASRRFRRT